MRGSGKGDPTVEKPAAASAIALARTAWGLGAAQPGDPPCAGELAMVITSPA